MRVDFISKYQDIKHRIMTKDEFIGKILEQVNEYLASEESYGDAAMLRIDPSTMQIELVDGEELDENAIDNDSADYYDLPDLLTMHPTDGTWLPDMDAISTLSNDYI